MRKTRREYLLNVLDYTKRGNDLPHAKLDPPKVKAIRALHGTATAKQIAARFGVHYRTVEKVLSYETWIHVL